MAFASASGYSNLPNGNFSPVIYSQKVQKEFRKTSVVEDITNTDYTGEISQFGDSVRIIKEPEITVSTYARGTTLATQDLADADFTMIVDQANYFQFSIDDIEAAHSHVNFMDLATDRAAYRLADTFDSEVLGYLSGWTGGAGSWARRTAANGTKAVSTADNDELLAANKLDITDFGGTDLGVLSEVTSIPMAANGGAGAITSPLALLNRIARKMDQANVDQDGRWVVLDPVMIELLMDEDSKFVDRDFGGGDEIRNGRMGGNLVRGFRVYKSNNLPYVGTGPDTTASGGSEDNFGVIVAGHDSAIASAQQLNKTETFRSPDTFSDIVRGMQLYGRKILRPEAIFTANYNVA
ncbi:putative coat protein [Roseobacter phage CRP-212]|nr:putative coat protein [Roseobacter phage CRP-212]